MERRKFTREFKLEAVRLITERGVNLAQASRRRLGRKERPEFRKFQGQSPVDPSDPCSYGPPAPRLRGDRPWSEPVAQG